MSNVWCHMDLSSDVVPPLVCLRQAWSRARYVAVIEQFANQGRYVRRDVDKDGDLDTFCNFFARDVMLAYSCPLPRMKANGMHYWLSGDDGRKAGWLSSTEAQAMVSAEQGRPTLASWANEAGPGHIAVVRPSEYIGVVCIAQAGKNNFIAGTLTEGFGDIQPSFWTQY